MKLLKLLMNRLFITAILIALQVLWIVIILLNLFQLQPILGLLSRGISIAVAIYVLAKDEDPNYKAIWVFLILLVPLFGGLAYLFFGNKKPARRLREAYDDDFNRSKQYVYPNNVLDEIKEDMYKGQMDYLVNLDYPVYNDSYAKYYSLGDSNYPDLIEELKKAQHFIFMEYFIVSKGRMFDEILEILKQKVQEGVEVRFMYDDVGCLSTLPRKYYLELEKYGIKATTYNPFVPLLSAVMNNRDHRKITVIDGNVGFCGGFNLADEYINQKERFGHWKDTGIMIKGNAVWNLTMMFLSSWHVATRTREDIGIYHPSRFELQDEKPNGYILPYGDSPLDNELTGSTVYLNMINQAISYIYIDTPYLIINEQIQSALISAVKRGVDVRITTPGIPDKKLIFKVTRSNYAPLVSNGVKIYEYTPGFIHAKNFVCDDKVATVGTINLDYRSLYLHFECGVYLYNCLAIQDIKQDYLDTCKVSKEITMTDIKKGKFGDLWAMILRVFSPIL